MSFLKDEDLGGLMTVQCSKCREFIYSSPGTLGTISHGLCPKCFEEEMDEIRKKYEAGDVL